MTREALIKHWNVIQAFKRGKQIQYKDLVAPEWENTDDPQFKLDVQYRVKPEQTKRLPTIEEVEQWFLDNKVYHSKKHGIFSRIQKFDKTFDAESIFILDNWYSILDFCNHFTNLDCSELYINEL